MQQADQQQRRVSDQSVALRGIGHIAQAILRRLASHLANKRPLDRPNASWMVRLVRDIGIRPIIFSVNCYIATILELFISFSLDLKSLAWAMTTVYLTSQPLSGALRAKAVYRVIGTFVGGAAMIAIVPNLVDAPELTTLAIILWVALCVFVSLLDRTPRAVRPGDLCDFAWRCHGDSNHFTTRIVDVRPELQP